MGRMMGKEKELRRGMKRRYILFMGAAVVPLLFFLNTWQAFRYEQTSRDIKAMEEQQREWLEKNKRLVAGISLLESPERIERLAREDLDLSVLKPGRLKQVFFVMPSEKGAAGKGARNE